MAVVSAGVPQYIADGLDAIAEEKLVSRSVVIRWALDAFLRQVDPRFFMPDRSINEPNEPQENHVEATPR